MAVLAGSSSSLRASSDPQLSLGTFFVPFFPLYSSLDVSSLLHCSSYTPRIICWDFRARMTKLLVSGSLNLLIYICSQILGQKSVCIQESAGTSWVLMYCTRAGDAKSTCIGACLQGRGQRDISSPCSHPEVVRSKSAPVLKPYE